MESELLLVAPSELQEFSPRLCGQVCNGEFRTS